MDYFEYRYGQLFAEELPIEQIAQEVGTPFYCYSYKTINRHYKIFDKAFEDVPHIICYAVKANSNLAILRLLAKLGSGADTVSEGEIRRSLRAGIPPEKIVFSGVGKTKAEITYALKKDILQFNVESFEELSLIASIAEQLGKKANVAIRVNPDVNADTIDKISTGRKGDKFGIEWNRAEEIYEKISQYKSLRVNGITIHIGSQLTSLQPFEKAFTKIKDLVQLLKSKGLRIKYLDLGGGLGIPYQQNSENIPPNPEEYAKMIVNMIKDLGCILVLEPGRLIVGNGGILVSKVTYNKKTSYKNFIILDAGMNDLMRPSLYGASHELVPVRKSGAKAEVMEKVDIVGPVCETSDIFAKELYLPQLKQGDLLAIRSSGAYGAVMSNEYNTRPLTAEVIVKDDKFAIIKHRPSYEEILKRDKIPKWI